MTGVGALNAGHGYIPRHLSGQVSDFKDEPDGGVSFSHPAAAGALTPSSPRTHLTQEQFLQTFDQPTRFTNLSDSIRGQYAPADSAVKTPARQTNETIARYLRQALERGTSSQGKSIGTVGLVSALGGGVGSYMHDLYKGDSGSPGTALIAALLAGGLGAAGTAWGQSTHNRRENFLAKQASSDVATGLVRLLEGDPSLSRHDKVMILKALSAAPDSDRRQLYSLLRTSVGAGVGMLAMRFLGAKG